jgi:hypothetical protein
MASSIEASDRFRRWKKSRTFLRLTLLTKDGIPEIFTGEIAALDFSEEVSLLSFVPRGAKNFFTLDLALLSFEEVD